MSSGDITIDLRMINASGIGTYLRNVVPRLIQYRGENRFFLLGDVTLLRDLPWTRTVNVRLIDCRSSIYSLAEQKELFLKIPKETDLFWSPHYNIPLFYRGKLLVTVHDVFHLAMGEFVGALHRRMYARIMFEAVRRKAHAIITVSRFTRDELCRLTGADSRSIHVVHNGVDESWFVKPAGGSPHTRPYLLYVGNVKPHKNLGALIEAFSSICSDIPNDLVIIGKREGFITGDSRAIRLASTLGERVYFTGPVEDDLLKRYMSFADALVFPSLYEGFGLPPLEAMACGTPVVVSDIPPLHEVCGDAAVYFDPRDIEDMATKILLVLRDGPLRAEHSFKGMEQAGNFDWEAAVSRTSDVLERVLSS